MFCSLYNRHTQKKWKCNIACLRWLRIQHDRHANFVDALMCCLRWWWEKCHKWMTEQSVSFYHIVSWQRNINLLTRVKIKNALSNTRKRRRKKNIQKFSHVIRVKSQFTEKKKEKKIYSTSIQIRDSNLLLTLFLHNIIRNSFRILQRIIRSKIDKIHRSLESGLPFFFSFFLQRMQRQRVT